MPPIKALLLLVLFLAPARADEPLTIAVSSNFRHAAEQIAAAFTADSGIRVGLSSGSTGLLYAQIVNGAPFDVFLAADTERPRLLEQSGLAVEGTLFSYAIGSIGVVVFIISALFVAVPGMLLGFCLFGLFGYNVGMARFERYCICKLLTNNLRTEGYLT